MSKTHLWIALFGLIGVFLRYGIDQLALRLAMPIPFNTLGINVLGSFLAGVIYVVGVERGWLPADLRAGVLVGFLGGFTTFSAYCLQSALLLERKVLWPLLIYWVGSPILGLIAAWAGIRMTRNWFPSYP